MMRARRGKLRVTARSCLASEQSTPCAGPITYTVKGHAMMEMAQAVELFITYREAENLSRRTIKWYRDHLGVFLKWLFAAGGDIEVAAIRSVDVARYIAEEASPDRRPRPLAPYTVRARYSTLRAFFNWAEEAEELGNPPSPNGYGSHKKVKPPRT